MSENDRFELADASHLLSRILINAEPYPREMIQKTGKSLTLDSTTDPIKLYMREMGSVMLLSRKEEVALGKKIETGREDHRSCIWLGLPLYWTRYWRLKTPSRLTLPVFVDFLILRKKNQVIQPGDETSIPSGNF